MVVPIPNSTGMQEQDFTLFEVGSQRAKNLRHSAEALAEDYTPPLPMPMTRGGSVVFGSAAAGSAAPLAVQSVGAYRISIAPTLADLQTRAPWNRFSIPQAHVSSKIDGQTSKREREREREMNKKDTRVACSAAWSAFFLTLQFDLSLLSSIPLLSFCVLSSLA